MHDGATNCQLLHMGTIDIVNTALECGHHYSIHQLSRGVTPLELGYQQMDTVDRNDPFIIALQDVCNPAKRHADLLKFCAFIGNVANSVFKPWYINMYPPLCAYVHCPVEGAQSQSMIKNGIAMGRIFQ